MQSNEAALAGLSKAFWRCAGMAADGPADAGSHIPVYLDLFERIPVDIVNRTGEVFDVLNHIAGQTSCGDVH